MRAFAFVTAAALALLGLPADTASAAPPGLPARPLDVELKQTEIGNVFRLLAEVSGRNVVLDPCVKGKIDLNLRNAPLPLVYDVLAAKLGLRYGERDGAVTVGCLAPNEPALAPDPRFEKRVSVEVRAVSARAALDVVAKAAGLAGVELRGDDTPKVTLALENVRLATVLAAIADETGLRVSLEGDRLVAEKP